MKAILLLEKGMEERDALDVVPVIVGYQDVGFDGAMAGLLLPSDCRVGGCPCRNRG